MKIIIDLDDKELNYKYYIPYWVYNVTIDIDNDLLGELDDVYNIKYRISHVNEQRVETFIPHINYLLINLDLYIYDNSLDIINENLENYRNK